MGGASNGTIFRKIVFQWHYQELQVGDYLPFYPILITLVFLPFLGIPANIRVLSTYIYEQIIGYGPSAFARASVLSVLLGIIAIIGTIVQWVIVRKSKVNETSKSRYGTKVFSIETVSVLQSNVFYGDSFL